MSPTAVTGNGRIRPLCRVDTDCAADCPALGRGAQVRRATPAGVDSGAEPCDEVYDSTSPSRCLTEHADPRDSLHVQRSCVPPAAAQKAQTANRIGGPCHSQGPSEMAF